MRMMAVAEMHIFVLYSSHFFITMTNFLSFSTYLVVCCSLAGLISQTTASNPSLQIPPVDTIRPTENPSSSNPWKAGAKISPKHIQKTGWESFFISSSIDNDLFKRINNKSYKADCTIPLTDLRYLKVLHYNSNDEICLGELICHKDISYDLIEIFKELFKAHYPIERMILIDEYDAQDEASMQDNNTSCFNFRRVAGTNILSNHSTGHAIDINPQYNPYVKIRNGRTTIQPKTGKAYINRFKSFPYKIEKNDLCYKLFKKHGFIWGGDWKSVKDFQHFEKKGN